MAITCGERQIIATKTSAIKELLDLNAYCLIHLLRYLPLKDLNAVGATCHKFWDIIDANNLHKYHKQITHLDIEAMKRRCYGESTHQMRYIGGYLERYGRFAEHVEFNQEMSEESQTQMFELIANYCLPTLKSLEFKNTKLNSTRTPNVRNLFENLTKLKTDSSLIWEKVLPLCVNLEELSLLVASGCHHGNVNLDHTFAKLKTLTVTIRDHVILQQFLRRFILALDSFVLRHLDLTSVSYSGIFSMASLRTLSTLTKLENVDISGGDKMDLSHFFCHSQSAEAVCHLTIRDCQVNAALIAGLGRFRHLRYLALNSRSDTVNISDVIWAQLEQLNELIELRLTIASTELAEGFVRHLTGAHRSLQVFAFNEYNNPQRYCAISDNFVASLAQFTRLEILQICLLSTNYVSDWQPFQHLTRLRKLKLSQNGLERQLLPANLLNNLGSGDTLCKLNIRCIDVDDCIQAIVKFSHLQELQLGVIFALSAAHIQRLHHLNRIRHFAVHAFGLAEDVYATILESADTWKSLEYIELRGNHSNIELWQNKLTDILNSRNDFPQLTMSVLENSIKISPSHRITQPYCIV